MFNDFLSAKCQECGSTNIEWHCMQTTRGGVVDGRLRLNEVTALFFCGCNECSETIKTITGDELAAMMTKGE